tara:strand:+ start:403 stop:534 length:132 start_codon:yes stop_codon:yes gene_type:complete
MYTREYVTNLRDYYSKDWPELEVTGGWIDEGYEGCGSFQQFWE